VLVDVAVPTKLSKRQRELLAELAAESGETVSDGGGGFIEKVLGKKPKHPRADGSHGG
jgi:DnaJ-class molecular chaperone